MNEYEVSYRHWIRKEGFVVTKTYLGDLVNIKIVNAETANEAIKQVKDDFYNIHIVGVKKI